MPFPNKINQQLHHYSKNIVEYVGFFQFLVCLLNAVGIPVLHAESQYSGVGSWMRDNLPFNQEMAERRWVTDDYASPVLYEYENERQLMNKKQKIKYQYSISACINSLIF